VWISAARQSAGRGRRGNRWQTLSGNLAATLLLTPAQPQAQWPQLSFAAAIAAAEMAAHFAPHARFAVKWPNDVLANGKKLSGLLLERAGPSLAIGIGINLSHFPPDTEYPATSLAALGVVPPEPGTALAVLAQAFAKWYESWMAEGFGVLRQAWLARAAGLGSSIRARLAQEERFGVFEGIDDHGALLLNEGKQTRAITAGEVFF